MAEEFFTWAFSSLEERVQRELEDQAKTEAIQREVEKIQRTLCYLDGTMVPQNSFQHGTLERYQDQMHQPSEEGSPIKGDHNVEYAMREIEMNSR